MAQDKKSSRIEGFYNLSWKERQEWLVDQGFLTSQEVESFLDSKGLDQETAEHMIENVIGTYSLPIGLAMNFMVNQREVVVPMVIEEPSVVAGASFMAKLAREGGGFQAACSEPVMIGQLQLLELPDLESAREKILQNQDDLLEKLEGLDPVLQKVGGGPKGIEGRVVPNSAIGPFLIVHLLLDV